MLSLFLLAWLLGFSPLPYSAVIVDAVTNRPLAGVHMRADAASTLSASTNTQGRFTLPGSSQALDLSLLGYAPLHVAVPAQPYSASAAA